MAGVEMRRITLLLALLYLLHKKVGQERYVGLAFTQGRNMNWKNVEPVVQILPESSFRDQQLQVPICGGYDSDIGLNGRCAAHSLEFSFLQYPEKLDLGGWRQVSDFVEKDCSPVRKLKTPFAASLWRR